MQERTPIQIKNVKDRISNQDKLIDAQGHERATLRIMQIQLTQPFCNEYVTRAQHSGSVAKPGRARLLIRAVFGGSNLSIPTISTTGMHI